MHAVYLKKTQLWQLRHSHKHKQTDVKNMSVNEDESNKYKNNVQSLKLNFSLFTKRIYIFPNNKWKKEKQK